MNQHIPLSSVNALAVSLKGGSWWGTKADYPPLPLRMADSSTTVGSTTSFTQTEATQDHQQQEQQNIVERETDAVYRELEIVTRRDGQRLIRLGSMQTFATVCRFEGSIKIHVRRYSHPDDNQCDDWLPTKSGIALSLTEFGDLLQSSDQLMDWSKELRPRILPPSSTTTSSSPSTSGFSSFSAPPPPGGPPHQYPPTAGGRNYQPPPPHFPPFHHPHQAYPAPVQFSSSRPFSTNLHRPAPVVGGGGGNWLYGAPSIQHHRQHHAPLYGGVVNQPLNPEEGDYTADWKEEDEGSDYWNTPNTGGGVGPSPSFVPLGTTTTTSESTLPHTTAFRPYDPRTSSTPLGGGGGLNNRKRSSTKTAVSTATSATGGTQGQSLNNRPVGGGDGGLEQEGEGREAPTPPLIIKEEPLSTKKKKKNDC